MDYLDSRLKEQYCYEVRAFSPKDFREGNGLSELDVLKAHYILSDYFLKRGEAVSYGVLKFDMLSSAVSRQYVEYDGKKKWEDDYSKIATLLFGLTLDHAFHDGNKRTALLSTLWFLNKCGREVRGEAVNYLEELVVRIASRSLSELKDFKRFANDPDSEVMFIAQKLKSWTRKVDRRLYTVTFSELDSNLKQFGYYLGSPSGNRINVYKKAKGISLFRGKDCRICQIGFPSWKEQVSPRDLKHLLKETGLDSNNGVDSEVFFNGATPSYELLKQYNEPLKRLKDS